MIQCFSVRQKKYQVPKRGTFKTATEYCVGILKYESSLIIFQPKLPQCVPWNIIKINYTSYVEHVPAADVFGRIHSSGGNCLSIRIFQTTYKQIFEWGRFLIFDYSNKYKIIILFQTNNKIKYSGYHLRNLKMGTSIITDKYRKKPSSKSVLEYNYTKEIITHELSRVKSHYVNLCRTPDIVCKL